MIALTEQSRVIPLSTSIALLAAFADTIIYASARFHHASLITSDKYFDGLSDVVYFRKSEPPVFIR
ncbi:MAG: hypothetical protein V3W04_04910 [Gammaproteobacteria bacterium]